MQVFTAYLSLDLSILYFILSSGFTGQGCEHNIDDCVQHACENGGRCMDGVNTYNCHCDKHWTGTAHYVILHSVIQYHNSVVNRPAL